MPDEPIYLEADPARIEQILANLLHNASKYTERGGHVWVSAELNAGFVVVRVKDNGVGIAADMLPRVFDLFSQVDRSLDRAAGGLGIGLTLVKSLVTLHNGTVEVSSPGVNRGSEFSVRLPTIAMRDWSRESKPSPSGAPGPVRRILVVDDNEDAAVTLMMALQIHEHQVQIAHEPQAALELAFASKPEVILLDIGLPGMSGYEVARRLRQDPALDRTIIIAITGYGQDEDRRRSADADIDFHLVKPVDMSVVNELLREGQRARKP